MEWEGGRSRGGGREGEGGGKWRGKGRGGKAEEYKQLTST